MSGQLQSVAHALRLLKLFERRTTWGVTGLAGELDLSTSTTHRLLLTMVTEGFLERLPSKKYKLAPGITLSTPSSVLARLLQVAQEPLHVLRDTTQATVHLAVLVGLSVRYVAAVESNRMVKVTSRVGLESPAHATAVGKVLLSFYSDEGLERMYRNRVFEEPTDRAIRSFEDLRGHVQLARTEHYARNISESEIGLYSIAVPILDARGKPICGLSLSGLVSHVEPHDGSGLSGTEMKLRQALEYCAERIQDAMAS